LEILLNTRRLLLIKAHVAYYKQYNYKSYFITKVSKLLALINYSYRNFPLRGVIKKVEALKTALLQYTPYIAQLIEENKVLL
jgi:hypothetical protein